VQLQHALVVGGHHLAGVHLARQVVDRLERALRPSNARAVARPVLALDQRLRSPRIVSALPVTEMSKPSFRAPGT
jgi:hypothetical protein